MIQADVKLDTLGYFCPMPIILTSKKIKELALGQVLEIVSDDEGIKNDMPAWCETTGHQMVGMERGTGKVRADLQSLCEEDQVAPRDRSDRLVGWIEVKPEITISSGFIVSFG